MTNLRKFSRKRQALLDALCASKEHPSAETLYQTLKPAYPELSLGTVYRNLALLAADGVIASVGVVCGEERFDGDTRPHAHLICEKCGSICDVPLPAERADLAALAEKKHFSTQSCRMEVRGLCARCRS